MLQLSLDWMNLDEAIEIAERTRENTDIIEVGTPLLFEYGLNAVKIMKEHFPDKVVLADMKIIDGGAGEAEMAFRQNADIITVMAAANDRTIEISAETAHKHGGLLMVDMLGVKDIVERTKTVEKLGADYVCVHTAFDMKDLQERPVEALRKVKESGCKLKTAIAGGITRKELDLILDEKPDLIIVGGGILNTSDPNVEARYFKERIAEKSADN